MDEGTTTRAARRAATATRILDAARAEFGERGFEATTVRAVAGRAGIDPSLVLQHYGSKAALFSAAVRLPDDDPGAATGHLLTVLGRKFDELPPETRALMRSMLTSPEAAGHMREFLTERVENLSRSLDGQDTELRAALAVSSLVGVTIARHFLGLAALADPGPEELARVAEPWLAALTTGPPPTAQAGGAASAALT